MQNIHVDDQYVVDPALMPLVKKLAFDKPQWVFDTRFSKERVRHYTEGTSCGDSRVRAPEGKEFIRRLRVLHDGVYIGEVGVERTWTSRYRNAGHNTVFTITSWRVGQDRSSGSTNKTSKLDVAARQAKKYFVAKTRTETWDDVKSSVLTHFQSATEELKRAIEYCRLSPGHSVLQNYAYFVSNNMHIPAALQDAVDRVMQSKTFHDALAQHALAEKMRHLSSNKCMRVIHILPDGNVMHEAEANKDEVVVRPMNELPDKWQSHIAVLRFVQDSELVLDVGFRYNNDAFMIIA